MGTVSVARKWNDVHGPTLDRYREFVPRELLAYWICAETGGDRLACSTDPKLVELGWPQAPIARAFQMGMDPFHVFGGLWCACREALDDAAHWRGVGSDDLQRQKIGRWLVKADSNLWYVIQMDYSVGTGALRYILSRAIARAEANKRGPEDRGLMVEAIDWASTADLAAHRSHWGRQSPEIILKRILKHRDWIHRAAQLGDLDSADPGDACPKSLPAGCPRFPTELVQNAKIAARDSTREELKASLADVRGYIRRRRRKEYAPKAPIGKRLVTAVGKGIEKISTFLGAEELHPVFVERDGQRPRAVIPW